jgi:mxaL protein
MPIDKLIRDYRFWCLALALAAMMLMSIHPTKRQRNPVYQLMVIVDITRSMNAEDYKQQEQAISRLTFVKQTLRELLLKLPCESKVGLGVFTDRRSSLLFEPIEVCSGFNEIDTAIAALDWRMAWAADSRIANGFFYTLEMLKGKKESILFITDGHEAPPVNPRYRTDFTTVKNTLNGLIVGVGGTQPTPIPKFNNRGEREGFYTPDDVPHRSSFGQSDLNPEQIEGYDARNAPFGSAEVVGTEHLTALNEPYLQQLAAETGFNYHRLTDAATLAESLNTSKYQIEHDTMVDVRWRAIIIVLILLTVLWFR